MEKGKKMEHKCKKSDSKPIEKCELNREQIAEMTREEVYKRYKEKKRMCKTVAQEVEMITSDTEMLLLRERLWGNDYE